MHRLVRHFSRTRRRPLSSVSLSAPIEVRPVFLRTTTSLGASGEAAGLLFRVAAVVAAASFLWTRREAAAVASSAASSFSDKDGDADAVAAVAADTFAGLVEDNSASIDRIWAAFVSVAASKKELNLVKAAHLSALLERIASSNSPIASSQALYTLQLLISKKLVPTASDVSNVLAATDSSTHATTKSILRILSPVLSSTRQLLFASAMAQNRLRVAEVVLADSYNHQDVDSGQFAESLIHTFVVRGVFARVDQIMHDMIDAGKWSLSKGLCVVASHMLDSKNYDLSAKYLIQLDDSIEKDCYYPDETFVAKVLVSFPNLGKQRLQLDSLLLRWMEDPRLPDYIRETASETRTSFQRSEHGRVSRATELCTMRGDVSTLHKLLETRESLVSSDEFQFHSWPKLVKASSFSGTLNVAETLSRLQNTPSAAVESSLMHFLAHNNLQDQTNLTPANASILNHRLIVFLTKNPSSPSPLHLISPSIVTSKTLHALTVHFLATPSNLSQLREFLATLKTKFPETSIETRTYNCILHTCHKHGHMGLFHYIRQQIKSPDSNTFAQLLIAAQCLGEVKTVLRDMKKQGVGIRNDLANQIMWKVASQDPEVVVSIWRALLRQGYMPRKRTALETLRKVKFGEEGIRTVWDMMNEEGVLLVSKEEVDEIVAKRRKGR